MSKPREPSMSACRCTRKRTVSGNTCTDCGLPVAKRPKLQDGDPDWDTACTTCEERPTVHPTELCGPCCFGEADTAGGNW